MNLPQRITCALIIMLAITACKETKEKEGNEAPVAAEMMQPAPILIFTKTVGYRHESIEKGVATLQDLGKQHNFSVAHTEDASNFNSAFLDDFEMIIFLSTTLDVLDSQQEQAFKAYINGGGNFMGIHAAADTEYDWPWYGQLVGAYFKSHPDQQEATINVISTKHAATKHLDATWTHFDEWYNYKDLNPNIQVLLQVDESSYSGGENGDFHPIAWYHEFDGGRSFYTGLGHTKEAYDDAKFRTHLVGGITYCLGRDL
jgi:type 1 glutamine amidotransferase